jgi:hypothetical protein
MNTEAIQRVIRLLEECDDIIYREARRRAELDRMLGRSTDPDDFTYTEDEVKLSEILDEARGQAHKMYTAGDVAQTG